MMHIMYQKYIQRFHMHINYSGWFGRKVSSRCEVGAPRVSQLATADAPVWYEKCAASWSQNHQTQRLHTHTNLPNTKQISETRCGIGHLDKSLHHCPPRYHHIAIPYVLNSLVSSINTLQLVQNVSWDVGSPKKKTYPTNCTTVGLPLHLLSNNFVSTTVAQ